MQGKSQAHFGVSKDGCSNIVLSSTEYWILNNLMRFCIFSLFLAVLRSLKATYEQALRRDDVRAIVVTGE